MIDWTRITELRREVGDDDFAEIAGLFLDELGTVIDDLSKATDPATLRDGFHSLKGSALNLGFAMLADLCAAAEATPDPAALGEIRTACKVSAAALRAQHPEIA